MLMDYSTEIDRFGGRGKSQIEQLTSRSINFLPNSPLPHHPSAAVAVLLGGPPPPAVRNCCCEATGLQNYKIFNFEFF